MGGVCPPCLYIQASQNKLLPPPFCPRVCVLVPRASIFPPFFSLLPFLLPTGRPRDFGALSRSEPCPCSSCDACCSMPQSASCTLLCLIVSTSLNIQLSCCQPQTDKAQILINPFSVDNTTVFPILRLAFFHKRLLVSGVMIPTKLSLLIPLQHRIFPLLSSSAPHTQGSPPPTNP